MQLAHKLHLAAAAVITIVLVGMATGAVAVLNRPTDSSVSSATITPPVTSSNGASSTTTPSSSLSNSTSYKDGTYTAMAQYDTPGGTEDITVTVALSGGGVSTVNVSQQANSRESQQYQMMFASMYKRSVEGKNINEIKLSRVAGSSLTSIGFNDALDQIKSHAAA